MKKGPIVINRLVLVFACLLGIISTAGSSDPQVCADDVFSKEKIVEVMRRVREYQLAHPWKETDRDWIRGTYYTGVMGLYRTTKDPEILAQARDWAEKHDWAEGGESSPANKKTCGQTYLELYFLDPDPRKIEKIQAYVDSRIELIDSGESPTKGWYYCDTLYVGPPTLAMLGKATGDPKYFDYLNRVYWAVTDLLYDEEYHLFYRDTKYLDAKTPAGRKVFWSRGNGWVLGGLPRVLQFLPKENECYQQYVQLFQIMAAEIASRQQADGLWRANLDDPTQCPNPETSGTAFFCYAMAWGLNNSLLDRDTFVPVVMRAWGGLTRYVHPDGKLGYVQPVGADPKPATTDMTHEYAMGLLLLAGEEIVKLLESGVVSAGEIAEFEKECREETEHGRWSSKTAWPDSVRTVDMPLSDGFRRLKAPETGRAAIQLTAGDAFCYPLERFIFCHPPNGMGMLTTDLDSGRYEYLRAGDPGLNAPAGDDTTRDHVCHFLATRRGVMYEVVGARQRSGLYDPLKRARFEFLLPEKFGYAHTGWDPEGRVWFWEDAARGHRMTTMKKLDAESGGEFFDLTGSWPTYGGGQKSHFHPQITPDRKWILFTGGDPRTQTNHLFLLEATDLKEMAAISPALLSPIGANDITSARLPQHLTAQAIPVKSVKASDAQEGHPARQAVDGDPTTLWASEGDGKSIQFDLGKPTTVARVYTVWFHGGERRQRFELAVSDDGQSWQTVFNGSSSGNTAKPEPCPAEPFTARYVRLTGHGNTINHWNSLGEIMFLAK